MGYRYTTPRIDTLRTDIAAARDMLDIAAAELDTLHHLAYTRPTATSTERTSGGTPDWALDNNGDQVARHALQTLARHITAACRTIHTGTREATKAIRDRTPDGVDDSRYRGRITAQEALEAVDALERRRQRGEFTPHRVSAQPVLRGVEAELKRELKRLRKENNRLQRKLNRLESDHRYKTSPDRVS